MSLTKRCSSRLGVASATLIVLCLSFHTREARSEADGFCPDVNPADVDDPADIDEEALRHWAMCKCGDNRGGDYVLATETEIDRYFVLINEPLLARYDTDCSLTIDNDELTKYLGNQTKAFNKQISDAKQGASERTAWQREKIASELTTKYAGAYPASEALTVLPDPPPDKKGLDLSYSTYSDSSQDVQNGKIGYSFRERTWRVPTTNSRVAVGMSIVLGQKDVETASTQTVSTTLDFFPVAWTLKPNKKLTFTLEGGIAYVRTDELSFTSGERSRLDDGAFVYKFGTAYQTGLPCLSLGIDYTVRTDNLLQKRLSSEIMPTMTVNFLKSCTRQAD